jgi:hypothetical protein
MGTTLSTSSRFLVSDVVEILEASGHFRGDRSGSIRALSSHSGWHELALRIGADDRLHVVVSTTPGEDSSLSLGDAEVRCELALDATLGAARVAATILALTGVLDLE